MVDRQAVRSRLMGRPCTVCERPEADRQAIDHEVIAGAPFRTISHTHSVSRYALMRHRAHISDALARVAVVHEQAEQRRAESLLDYVQLLIAESRSALDDFKRSGAGGLRLNAIRELRASV